MKGLWAKKQAKMQQKNGNVKEKQGSDFEAVNREKTDGKKSSNQVKLVVVLFYFLLLYAFPSWFLLLIVFISKVLLRF